MSLIKAEKKEHNICELEIKIEADVFAAAVNAVAKRELKRYNIPGFRKGKAPRSLVEKMYGKGVFYEDAINDLLPEAYESAVKEAAIEPVGRPEFDISSLDENDGVVLVVKVAVKPDVEIADYLGIAVERTVVKASDAEVDEELEIARNRNSREIEITDRAAQLGDVTNIDYEGFCDGVAFDGGKAEGSPLKLGSGQFIPGFEDQIVGHTIGEEFDVNVTFPEEYHAAELAGKAVVFKVKLNGINAIELPALDDEFAKDISEFDTLDEYKADLKAKIQKRHDKVAENEVNDQLGNALIDKLVAEIPEEMFDREVENIVRDYDMRLRQQGMSLELYFRYTGLDLDKMREQARPEAVRQVKMRLALEKIAALENIAVSDEDVEAEIKRIADENHVTVEQVKEIVAADGVREDLKVQRALELVREKAVVTDKKAKKPAAKKSTSTTKKTTTKKTTAKKAATEETPAEETVAAEETKAE
ncbi:MAG: trigger factor [Clostridia bacterium]|nr:trigger factor [Clostridia bacterium]